MFQINQTARENFDQKALAVLKSIKTLPSMENTPSRFPSEIHVTANIDEADVIGEITQFAVDAKGRICERFFIHNEIKIGLIISDYANFKIVAENVQRLKGIRDQLSVKFVEDTLFSWLKEAYQRGFVQVQFLDYLESSAFRKIEKIRVYVPMAFTSVELPFEFGGVVIENISKALIDAHEPSMSSLQEDVRPHAEQYFKKFRENFQGYAAIRLDIECEPQFAKELSLERAHAVADLLCIYSGKVLIPDARCSSRPKGAEFIEKSTVIIVGQNDKFRVFENIVDTNSIETWMISQYELSQYSKFGFNDLSALFKSGGGTEFEKSILNMAFLYAKSAFTSDPMAKVIYVLSALESILLKNQSEPIQQNLGERLAIFSATELNDRKIILKNVRSVYDLRSRYLHHGHSSSELEEIQNFLMNVWIFFVKIVGNRQTYSTKEEFLIRIDDEKLS